MYTALVADGSQIPPVIFTNDLNVPAGVEGRNDAFVIYVPTLTTTPSANVTLRWLDTISDYTDDEPHMIHDSGNEFTAREVQNHCGESFITTHRIPAAGGAFLNPCDNNFHHDMKHHYYRKPHNTHVEMLRAMIDAYYEVPDQNIRHYFEHCRIVGKLLTRRYTQKLLSEGYCPGRNHEELHEQCRNTYRAWKKNVRILNNTVREDVRNFVVSDDTLDGVYWYPHVNN
jgi:hypothetical protein